MQARFQRAYRQPKHARSLLQGIVRRFTELDCLTHFGRQLTQRMLQHFSPFQPLEMLLGSRLRVSYVFAERQVIEFIFDLVPGNRGLRAGLADVLQRGVDDDTGRPGQEIGTALKLVQTCKRSEHRFLDGVFGVLRPGKNP